MDKKTNKQSSKSTINRGRKNNPDYEAVMVNTRDGVKQKVYKKKQSAKDKEPPKRKKGTPEKRRGAFKQPKKNVGLMNSPPTTASSMAKPIGSYSAQQAEKAAMASIDNIERLSEKKREELQGQAKAPKQVALAKTRSRTNPNA